MRRSRLREDALQCRAGKGPCSRLNEPTWSAAADLNRLTGRQAGTLQASELHARLAIDRLPLQLQLSCPHSTACGLVSSLNAAALAEASRNQSRSFYVFSRVANCGCTIRYTNTLRFNSINWTHLSRAHSSMGFRLPRC